MAQKGVTVSAHCLHGSGAENQLCFPMVVSAFWIGKETAEIWCFQYRLQNLLKRGQYIGDLRSNTGAFLQVAFWEERGFNFSVQFQFVQWQFEFSWKFSFLHWSLSDFSAGEAE